MAITDSELFAFIYREAWILDEERYPEWLALFADDGRYWVPLQGRFQADDGRGNSIADEDRMLLALRVERLRAGMAHSQQPTSHMQHVLQQPQLIDSEEGAAAFTLRTPFSYAESRGDEVISLHGHYVHRLVVVRGEVRIALKRVNLVNSTSRLPMIQLFP